MAHKLELVSPLSVLKRGYSGCSSQKGLIIKDISASSVGESVSVRLSKGGFQAKVLDVL
jgi:exodeoxyribonuclease VII large subunit